MSGSFLISRRALLAGVAGAIGLRALPGLADDKPPSDRGIGGTGITGQPGHDHAIGFVGSIQRFGSIYVNGDRITYPDDVAVTVDGQPRGPADLLIGQMVKTVATRQDGKLSTDRIDVTSEVVGAIEQLAGDTLVVLGQQVTLGTTGTKDFSIGQRIAVSGIRRTDGTIVARLVEPAGDRGDQVVGAAVYRGWTLRIGSLRLFGPDARYDGYRVVARGRRTARGLVVASIGLDQLPDGSNVRVLSIEAYVARHGNEVQLGSGVVFSNVGGGGGATAMADQPSVVSVQLPGAAGIGQVGVDTARTSGRDNWVRSPPSAVVPTGTYGTTMPVAAIGTARLPDVRTGASIGSGLPYGGMTYRSSPGAGWSIGRRGGL